MANKAVLNYLPRNSFIHRLTGTSKLIFFLLFTFASMLTFDMRVLVILLIFSAVMFKLSKIEFKEISFMFYLLLAFLAVNAFFIFLFNPNYGPDLYGTYHSVIKLTAKYTITLEQLFYQVSLLMKYITALPIAILFISTTNPSEFASSLNSIGIPYSIAYSVALALRFIPDVQRDYHEISQAQQARGTELGKDARLFERIKNSISILLPLLLTSISRIDVISNAMQLRGFGKNKKRSWYTQRKFARNDYIVIIVGILLLIFSLSMTKINGSRFFNPFI